MSGDTVAGRHGRPQRAMEEVPQEYAAFKIEQRGIDLIPDAERKMKPSGLFWLWAGAVFNVEFFFYGTLIMFFGLSVAQAIAVILVGNLAYSLLGFASLQGPKTGTTTFMVSRAPFGQNGNRLVALFNWITQVGFEIEGVYFVVATVILLFSLHGTNLDTPAKVVVIILAAALQMVIPLLGHATISKVLRYLSYVFIVFFVVLAAFTLSRLHLSTFHQKPATFAVWTTALVLVISAGGLGWTENGNDYSRYLPRNTPSSRTFWAATLGGAIPSIILEILGVLAFTITTKTVGISQLGVPQSFPAWFVTPFLLFAVFQLLAINTIDMYSSGVTLQALGLPAKRWVTVIIDTVLCAAVTAYIVFGKQSFFSYFTAFLLYIVVWLAPWFGILLTDYLLRGRQYHSLSLRSSRDGLYWRGGGVHWPAIIAQVAGMVLALLWINVQPYPTNWFAFTGPISKHFPGLAGGDFSWALGLIGGALVYWLLAGRSVRAEAAQAVLGVANDAQLPAAAPQLAGGGGQRSFIEAMPKAELHLHLEGTLEPELRNQLAIRNQLPPAAGRKDYTDLTSFLTAYYAAMDVLRTEQDFYDLAMAYFRKASEQHVVYAEVFFDPQAHTSRGIPFETVINGIDRARNEAGPLRAQLIMCFLRDRDAGDAMRTLEQAAPHRHKIKGVGLDSDERDNPPVKFKQVFAAAREEGYRLTMHCDVDQQDSVAHIWQCLDDIGVERIDHGVNCLEDKALVTRLAKDRIGLTVCPISNRWVTDGLKAAELKSMLDHGLRATVNSDDPAYFGGYITENFVEVARAARLTQQEIGQLAQNAFDISWR